VGTVQTVRAVNSLAADWALAAPANGDGTVFMPAGVWPLLAFLAAGANAPVRAELEDALRMPVAEATEHARGLLATLRGRPGIGAALGLWASDSLLPDPRWLAELPEHVHGSLTGDPATDRARLDDWAARSTDGLIDSMPITPDEETRLILAAALTVRTEWLRPFSRAWYEATDGPWAGRQVGYLGRLTSLLDRVAVAETPAGPVTELRVHGRDNIDVHLLLGEEGALPGQVLAAGVGILAGAHRRVTADLLQDGRPGPGVRIGWVRSYRRDPELHAVIPEFTVNADHDLLAAPDLFGLALAADGGDGRLPGLGGPEPLFVAAAAQAATATFGPRGFRAASVTAFSVAVGGSASLPPYRVRQVTAAFDRPFGFLAVERCSRLVLAAGWVTDPDEPSREEDEEDGEDLDW